MRRELFNFMLNSCRASRNHHRRHYIAIFIYHPFLSDDLTMPTILFKARDVKNRNPESGDNLIYQTVLTDIHTNLTGGYDSDTGIFTVPYTGTYLFTVQTCTYSRKWFMGKIVAADVEISAFSQYEDSGTARTCSTATGMAVLSKGETVYVECSNAGPASGSILLDDVNRWNMFSGVLINTGTD